MQGNKRLVIGLVTGIAVLLIVAAVLTVLLVRGGGLSGGSGVSGKGGTDILIFLRQGQCGEPAGDRRHAVQGFLCCGAVAGTEETTCYMKRSIW